MTRIGLQGDDFEDLIEKIEKSYDIKFDRNDFQGVLTFEQLCDAVLHKIRLPENDNCTTQQTFYKLRQSIRKIKEQDELEIYPSTKLVALFPKKDRRKRIKLLENELGLRLNILTSMWYVVAITISVVSFIVIFINFKIGLLSFILSVAFFQIVRLTANTFTLKTIGQLADEITSENYFKIRRDSTTINRQEIKRLITKMIGDLTGVDDKEIKPETLVF